MIIGFFGFQRSGKSGTAMYLAKQLYDQFGMEIYTNMDTYKTCNEISCLTDIPVNEKSKILLWDEIHFDIDSRKIKSNIDFTPFLSTIGKQKILLLYTCPTPDLVDKRIRNYTSYMFMCKGDKQNIYTQIVDLLRASASPIYSLKKNDEFFKYVNYNSDLVIPNQIHANIQDYIQNVKNLRNMA